MNKSRQHTAIGNILVIKKVNFIIWFITEVNMLVEIYRTREKQIYRKPYSPSDNVNITHSPILLTP